MVKKLNVIFFTIGDKAIMIVAKKVDELDDQTVIHEMITLSSEAQFLYEQSYNN